MLSHELNSKIVKLAPKHVAKLSAPETFNDLVSNLGELIVYSGSSDQTIYGSESVNHAFRAWHDSLHISLNAPFTLDGETVVAMEQARLLGGMYGDILIAEVIGQAEYFQTHGTFPVNQTEFVVNYLKGLNKC